jgi:hypothetical protein
VGRRCPAGIDDLDYAFGAGDELVGVRAGTNALQRSPFRRVLQARLAAGAHAFEEPQLAWWAACDEWALQACLDEHGALNMAIGYRWVADRRDALARAAS